jgi:hypothetical protein
VSVLQYGIVCDLVDQITPFTMWGIRIKLWTHGHVWNKNTPLSLRHTHIQLLGKSQRATLPESREGFTGSNAGRAQTCNVNQYNTFILLLVLTHSMHDIQTKEHNKTRLIHWGKEKRTIFANKVRLVPIWEKDNRHAYQHTRHSEQETNKGGRDSE